MEEMGGLSDLFGSGVGGGGRVSAGENEIAADEKRKKMFQDLGGALSAAGSGGGRGGMSFSPIQPGQFAAPVFGVSPENIMGDPRYEALSRLSR